MTCTHANQCDTVRKTTGMHGSSTKVSSREVPIARAMAHQLVGRYNLVRIRTYGCSRSQYTGTAVLVHRYPCTNVSVCNLCVQFLQKTTWYYIFVPVQVLQKKVPGPVISTSTNTGTISRESTDFIFYPVPYALACQK